MEPYPFHGGQLSQIATHFNIPQSELLDFSANINPSGPPPAVLTALHASLDDPATLTVYPDLQQTALKQAIARYTGAQLQNMIVANGFVPILEAALRTLKLQTCLLPVPAFVEYRKTLERTGTTITPHPLTSFQYDPAAMLTQPHDAILLANPQNPSGVCHDATTIRRLIQNAAKTNTYILLDEAFIDYTPENSLTSEINDHKNLIVFRSVTKFHAIPGLRVAYAVTHPILAAAVNERLPPWPITTLASHAAIAALADEAYAITSRRENLERRSALHQGLESLGLHVYPGAANFLLFRLPPTFNPDQFWQEMITTHHIVLRACANYETLAPSHFRTAVRTPIENGKLVHAIRQCLQHLPAFY